MNEYSMYELKCPNCDQRYTQMLTQQEESLVIPCPSCGTSLEILRKLTGSELLSCISSYGGT
jgi:hypothetical protein